MKYILSLIIILILLKLFVFTSINNQPAVGPHGGIIKEAEGYNIEVKTSYPTIYAFLLDKNLKPLSNKGIFCEIRFFPDNETPIDVSLKPYEGDGFKMESTTISYLSYRVTFNIFGRSVSAKFDNENAIVQK